VALNEYVLSLLLQAGFSIGYTVSAPIMGHVGRRPQYFASSIFMATSLVVLAASLNAMVRE
jgi:MFS family permease